MRIGIINYGLGNINSIKNAVCYVNNNVQIKMINYPEEVTKFDKLILPGVGAFEDAIKLITVKNFDDALKIEKKKGKYILGVCLGMQLLGTKSYEFGEHKGLNFIEGEVLKFDSSKNERVPHIGWNNLRWNSNNELFDGINNGSDFYFVHSYFFRCKNNNHSIGETHYIDKFSSVIRNDNIIGTQFHPEKSQKDGLKLIENFLKL